MPKIELHLPQQKGTRPLILGDFESLSAELKQMRSACVSQAILGFVRGLRLSARIIYFLRKYLSDLSLEVDWGHLVDVDENYISRECDIVIHKAGIYQEWDGFQNPIMHFRFIKCDKTVAVVSCKSFISSASQIDTNYCTYMQPYVKNVFLFAECCPARSLPFIRKKLSQAGYAGFGYLYLFNQVTGESENDPPVWESFLRSIREKCELQNR
jgi:hypothetical protein